MDATIVQAENVATPEPAVGFTGRRWPLFRLVLKNLGLTVLTLGIYRFWAKTAIRRYFWSHTRIGGEPLEYTGRGLELFVGFLIVLAVLLPLGMLFGAIQAVASIAAVWVDPLLSALNFLIILFLIQFAVFRMTRYRLTRTRWRGIRFGLDGKPLRYAVRGFLWILSLVSSLGLTSPFMTVNLARYRVERMRFGDKHFTFVGTGKALLGPWLIKSLSLFTGVAAFIALNIPWFQKVLARIIEVVQSETMPSFDAMQGPAFVPVIFSGIVLWAVLSVWYQVREFRYLVGGIIFDGVRIDSGLSAGRVYGLVFLTGLLILLIVGGAIGFFALSLRGIGEAVPLIFAPILGVFLFLGVTAVIKTVIWRVAITRVVCKTLTISDLGPFERAAQSAAADPRFGEGLADAFDVDAF